jgi:hypothetical protein
MFSSFALYPCKLLLLHKNPLAEEPVSLLLVVFQLICYWLLHKIRTKFLQLYLDISILLYNSLFSIRNKVSLAYFIRFLAAFGSQSRTLDSQNPSVSNHSCHSFLCVYIFSRSYDYLHWLMC